MCCSQRLAWIWVGAIPKVKCESTNQGVLPSITFKPQKTSLRRLETVREQLFVTALCFKKQVTRFGFRKEPLRQHMLSLQFIGCVSLTVSSCHLSIQAIRPSLPFRGKKGSPIAYAAMRSMDRRATSSVGMECIPSAVAAWEHRFAEFATENEKRTDVEGCRMLKACLSWWL